MASTLHALFKYAFDDKKRLDNPADDLKLPEVAQGDMFELTLDDYGRLAQALGPGHTTFIYGRGRDRAARGEYAGISWPTLTWAGTLRVALQLDRGPSSFSPTKNRTSAAIALGEATLKELSEDPQNKWTPDTLT